MERLEVITERIGHVTQLKQVVGAIRSLAALRLNQANETLEGVRRYSHVIGAALSRALTLTAEASWHEERFSQAPSATLMFSAEHGFVGNYAEALAEAAKGSGPLFIIGTKGAIAAGDIGRRPDWSMAMPSHAGGLASVASAIAHELARRLQAREFASLDLVFGRAVAGGRWEVERRSILPLDRSRFAAASPLVPPLVHLAPDVLMDRLVAEYVQAELLNAATEALAAENAARLQAMSAAFDNIERKLEELQGQERILRQNRITDELLDVINGAEVLLASAPRPAGRRRRFPWTNARRP